MGRREGGGERGQARVTFEEAATVITDPDAVMSNRPTKADVDESSDIDLSRAKVVDRGLKKDRRLTLQTLRVALGKTQADIARAAEMDQGDVSRLEARDDKKVSTLGRYAAALGGRLEVAIVVDGRRFLLDV
jgi:hypothetical protein